MTFSGETRLELARIVPENRCCAVAELVGMLLAEGVFPDEDALRKKDAFRFSLSHPSLGRTVYRLVKKIDGNITVNVLRHVGRARRRSYLVELTDEDFTLNRLWNEQQSHRGTGSFVPRRPCCRKALLRGAFLCRGSVSAPVRQYHFEISVDRQHAARLLTACLESFGQPGRVSRRKNVYIVYLKESERIVDVLSLMGAHQALLKLENIRIVKGMRNRVNRLVNCETANVDKTVNAALEQIEAIRLIDRIQGLDQLSNPLRELARMRLDHPYASLRELGERMNPKMSKSGVNYRMRRLMRVAESLQQGDG